MAIPAIDEANKAAIEAAQKAAEKAAAEAKAKEEKPSPGDSASTTPELRTWTDTTGRHSYAARFVTLEGEIVQLEKADGTRMTVPLDRLSEPDREWVLVYVSAEGDP